MADLLVRAKNIGTKDFVQLYANVRYHIKPGEQTVIPLEAMKLWTGDPGLLGDERLAEMNRLMFRFGKLTDADSWDDFCPTLEITNLDGEHVTTVLEDPDGLSVTPASATLREQADLERVIADLQHQQELMKGQLKRLGWNDDKEEPLQDVPKSVPVGERRGRVGESS